jgi:hypothetical protein
MDEDNFICQSPKEPVPSRFFTGLFWGCAYSIPIWMIIGITTYLFFFR